MYNVPPSRKKATKKQGRPLKSQSILNEQSILITARKLVAQKGLDSFSMRNLAKELHADPMSIYHYFPSKDELILSLMNDSYSIYSKKISKNKNAPGLKELCHSYLNFCFQNMDLIRFASSLPVNVDISSLSQILMSELRKKGVKESELTETYHLIIDFIHGFALSGKRRNAFVHFEKELSILFRIFPGK